MAFTATTAEVASHFRVARNTLGRLRAADVLRPGVHFVATGVGIKRPNLRWDLPAVEAALQRRGRQLKQPKNN